MRGSSTCSRANLIEGAVALALGLSRTFAARSAISALVSAFGRTCERTLAAKLFVRALAVGSCRTFAALDASRDDDLRLVLMVDAFAWVFPTR